jgi:hypothetical protein
VPPLVFTFFLLPRLVPVPRVLPPRARGALPPLVEDDLGRLEGAPFSGQSSRTNQLVSIKEIQVPNTCRPVPCLTAFKTLVICGCASSGPFFSSCGSRSWARGHHARTSCSSLGCSLKIVANVERIKLVTVTIVANFSALETRR